jgi:hypothetical protein
VNALNIRARSARLAIALAMMLASSAVASVAQSGHAGAHVQVRAQVPTPPRPLLLIGGTLADVNYSGWAGIQSWLETRGGYRVEDNNLFIGEMCLDTSDDPYDFLKCSPPINSEGERPDPPQPSGWNPLVFPPQYQWVTWDFVVSITRAGGGSTAGWAAMSKSVDHVANQINLVRLATGAPQIDIIAHSQAGVIARAAIRKLVAAGQQSPVANLVSLGAPQYGASPLARLYDDFNNVIPGFFDLCRDHTLVPFCRDIFLAPPASTARAGSHVPLTNPLGFTSTEGAAVPFTYRDTPDDFFTTLNSSSAPGPAPGPTHYYNFYTRDYDGDGNPPDDRERYIVEQMNLFPNQPNVTNLNVQDLCLLFGVANYPLHHSAEFDDPTMRALIGSALGFPYTEPQACEPLP